MFVCLRRFSIVPSLQVSRLLLAYVFFTFSNQIHLLQNLLAWISARRKVKVERIVQLCCSITKAVRYNHLTRSSLTKRSLLIFSKLWGLSTYQFAHRSIKNQRHILRTLEEGVLLAYREQFTLQYCYGQYERIFSTKRYNKKKSKWSSEETKLSEEEETRWSAESIVIFDYGFSKTHK